MKNTVPVALTFTVGAVFGIALVLSCGGDNRSAADAACNCPVSEPPLTGRFITVSNVRTIAPGPAPGGQGGQDAVCPAGAQVISGSCTSATLNPIPQTLLLIESGFSEVAPTLPRGWDCEFKNTGTVPIDIKATVICLLPAT